MSSQPAWHVLLAAHLLLCVASESRKTVSKIAWLRGMWKSLVTIARRFQPAGTAWIVAAKYALPMVS